MPRKAKEKEIIENENIVEKDGNLISKPVRKSSKSETSKSSVASKKNLESSPKSDSKSVAKKSSTDKDIDNSKSTSKKTTRSNSRKTTTTKKSTVAKKTSTSRKKSVNKNTESIDTDSTTKLEILEYYDLPYKYGNTLVKLLAQTPKTLFVYWEVSDLDILNYKQQYGDDFFNITKPILIVHNLTLNKTYEVEINDFANCWYLSTEDSDCKFDIELARKFIEHTSNSAKIEKVKNDYLYLAQSNDLESPNDHILFEKLNNFVTFKNVETNDTIQKNINSFTFLSDLYKFYKDMYKDEILKNPSSNFYF